MLAQRRNEESVACGMLALLPRGVDEDTHGLKPLGEVLLLAVCYLLLQKKYDQKFDGAQHAYEKSVVRKRSNVGKTTQYYIHTSKSKYTIFGFFLYLKAPALTTWVIP